MPEKTLSTRVVNKHDSSTNWDKAVNFVPKAGELVVYDDLHKAKLGNGTSKVGDLPFLDKQNLTRSKLWKSVKMF